MANERVDEATRASGDTQVLQALGIDFDGRSYWYRDYRYDLLQDAINYARLDRARPSYREAPRVPRRRDEPPVATAAQQQAMKALGVTFDGKQYLFGGYRYDRCADAINYARLKKE